MGAVRGVLCVEHNVLIGHVEKFLRDPAQILWYLTRGADYRAVDREA
jgi:hypothetical protein